ncbi:MAG TPA: hypothetical protein VL996_15215 [Methylocella sp.]|nr:hypothetical protein [Methylocella sp.]
MPDPSPAQFHAEAAFRAQALRTVIHLVKHRARAYAKRPMSLEMVAPGLAAAAPETMAAVAKQLIEKETMAPRRWFGFGGEVPILNAKAVLLLARARRRAARTPAPPAAAGP